jgi:hypothetical protein
MAGQRGYQSHALHRALGEDASYRFVPALFEVIDTGAAEDGAE